MSQLRMSYIANGDALPPLPALPDGYSYRPYTAADRDGYLALREVSEFRGWTPTVLANFAPCLVPNGLMLIVDANNAPVASACAQLNTLFLWPYNGNLGWVMADPAHRGKGLGKAIVAATMRRLLIYGCRQLWLSTDDWREPALASYLKLGWRPWITDDDHPARWAAVFEKLHLTPVAPIDKLPPKGPDGF